MDAVNDFVSVLVQWSEVYMHNSMRNFFRYSKKNGLSMSQIGALFWVSHKGNSAVSDLSDKLGITSAATSQMLERLVQQGLILRSEDPNDRRVKQIALTNQGRAVLQESLLARQSWIGSLAEVMTDSEKEQVVQALNLLLAKAHLGAMDDHPIAP
jgi:DNA-binding MarR family transcriptional regulator